MIKRSMKITLELVAVTLAGLAVLLFLGVARLAVGPMPVGFITPYIEAGLSGGETGSTVKIDQTIIAWAGWERTLDIVLKGVHVLGPDKAERAFVPNLAVGFSLRALLEGRMAPSRLALSGAHFRVVRTPEGRITLGEPGASEAAGGATQIGGGFTADLLAILARPPDRHGPLGYLRRVSMIDSTIVFDDQRGGVTLAAPNSEIDLNRDGGGLRGTASLNLVIGGTRSRVELAGAYDLSSKLLELESRFHDIEPAAFASLEARLAPVKGVHLPLTGSVSVSVGLDGHVDSFLIDAESGPGTVELPEQFDQPIKVRAARLKASASERASRLVVESLSADFGGPRLAIAARATRADGKLHAAVNVVARDVTSADLRRLWPKTAAEGGREWVFENVEDGGVGELRASVELAGAEPRPGHFEQVAVTKLDGRFDYSGLTIHYLRPLPPVTGVKGSARMTPSTFTFDVSEGALGALKVSKGRFRLSGLDTSKHRFDMNATIDGPVAPVMTLLNHPRLDLLKGLAIKPAAVKGSASTRLTMQFPLIKKLTFDHVDIGAESRLSDVALPGVALGNDLTEGDLALSLTKRSMEVSGNVKLGGVPASLQWTENFYSGAAFRSRYVVKGTADNAARRKFGLGFLDAYAQGPVGADLVITGFDGGRMSLAAALDLKAVALSFADIYWSKPAGVGGFARLVLAIRDDRVERIDNLTIRAGDLKAAGDVRLTPDGKDIASFDFKNVTFDGTDVKARGKFTPDGALVLDVSGDKVDVRKFLAARNDGKPKRPLDITVAATTVRAAPNGVISGVKGRLRRDANDWQFVDIRGTVGKGTPLTISIAPEAGVRKLHIRSNDAGAALRAFDMTDNMIGGTLEIKGTYDDTKKGRPLTGHFAVRKFQMVKAPFLAKLLAVASLTGILDALSGQGISFERADAPFIKTGDILELKDARAYGSAVGFTAKGFIDLDKDTEDLTGEVVPAYLLNSFFENIPILGPLIFVPEKGSGLIAMRYKMTGKIDDPDVSVNPLSGLTPGFLRNMFNIFDTPTKPKAAPAPAPAPKAAPPPKDAPTATP